MLKEEWKCATMKNHVSAIGSEIYILELDIELLIKYYDILRKRYIGCQTSPKTQTHLFVT